MRLRKAFEGSGEPVRFLEADVDETYIGGLEKNRHCGRKLWAGRGGVGKSVVVAVRDRESGTMVAKVVPDTTRGAIHWPAPRSSAP